MKRWQKGSLLIVCATLPLLIAASGGFPSRPIFQAVTIQTAGATSTDLLINQNGAAANNRIFRIRNNGAGNFQMGAFNDALSTGTNFLIATASGATPTISLLNLSATSVQVNGNEVATQSNATFSLTGTGFASSPVWNCRYAIAGKVAAVNCDDRFNTTSNATTFGMTGWPAAINPAQQCNSPMIFGANNSAAVNARLFVDTAGGVTVQHTLSFSGTGTAWTAAGTKGLAGFNVSCVIP